MTIAGPSGGTGGGGFVDPPPENFKVVSVMIFAGDFVDGVQLILLTPNGELFELPHHGGLGEPRTTSTLSTMSTS